MIPTLPSTPKATEMFDQYALCDECGRVNPMENIDTGCYDCHESRWRIIWLKWVRDRDTGILGSVADGHYENRWGKRIGKMYRILLGGWVL